MGKAIKIISDVLFIAGLVVAGIFLIGHFTGRQFFSAYIVSSGSMEPAIKTGSVVIVTPKSNYEVADIVTYRTGSDKKSTTTHRIVGIDESVAKTAGDSNNQPDPVLVPRDKIIGVVRFAVPYAGYLAASAKTPQGFILLVIVPATIIVYEELKSLVFEIRKGLGRLRNRKGHAGMKQIVSHLDPDNDQVERNVFANAEWTSGLLKPAVIIPVLCAGIILFTFSGSFFRDTESSQTNSFTAWTETPPQIAKTLVMNEVLPVSTCFLGQTEGQFIELWNGLDDTTNLKDYQLSDGTDTIAIANSNTNLPSHAFAILVKSTGLINQCLGGDVHGAVVVNLGSHINLNSGILYLLDSTGTTVDTVRWSPAPSPALPAPTADTSFERNPIGHDSVDGTIFEPSDFESSSPPTPGLGFGETVATLSITSPSDKSPGKEEPTPTETPIPTITETPAPIPTEIPVPSPTDTPIPTEIPLPTETPTPTP